MRRWIGNESDDRITSAVSFGFFLFQFQTVCSFDIEFLKINRNWIKIIHTVRNLFRKSIWNFPASEISERMHEVLFTRWRHYCWCEEINVRCSVDISFCYCYQSFGRSSWNVLRIIHQSSSHWNFFRRNTTFDGIQTNRERKRDGERNQTRGVKSDIPFMLFTIYILSVVWCVHWSHLVIRQIFQILKMIKVLGSFAICVSTRQV